MKSIIFSVALAVTILTACNSNGNKSAKGQNSKDSLTMSHTEHENVASTPVEDEINISTLKEIVDMYLQLKNALAEDNSSAAAASGRKLKAAFNSFDKTVLSATQKKAFEDVEDDAREHAEHIGESDGNIAHQREHFEMLSNDVYDLVKAFGGGLVLYYTFCPMYNDSKGAYWLSETREIINPYLGKSMPTCGEVKEVIK